MVKFSAGQKEARRLLHDSQRYTCLAGGTRSGKTFIIVEAILDRARSAPGSRHAILRFHANAARASIALDTLPRVMQLCFPGESLKEHRQDAFFELANGSRIWIGGLDDKDRVEKILGLEYATIFLNEASQIPYSSALVAFTRLAQVVEQRFADEHSLTKTRRLPQKLFVDLNPIGKTHWTNVLFGDKRDPVSRQPLRDPESYARAFLNPTDNAENLSPDFLRSLEALPEKQRKRFYEGVYVDEIDGALWTYEVIDKARCTLDDIPEQMRATVVVGLDPSGAAGRDDLASDEIGIVVAARGRNGDCYILDDRSCREAPAVWGRRAVVAFHEFRADCIVAESNFGGEMVRATIQAADTNVPVRLVAASRGKAVRAEPISVRYGQGQVHHAGRFAKLEDQLCAFSGAGYGGAGSPDHADAAIWALTYLFGAEDGTGIIEFYRRAAQGSDPT